MTEPDLIGYELDLLDAVDRAAVESYLAADPDAARRLAAARRALAPLAADRDPPDAPRGLALRAIARAAEHLASLPRDPAPVEPSRRPSDPDSWPELALPPPRAAGVGFPADSPDPRAVGMRFRPDLIVAAGIGLLAVGLIASGVNRARSENRLAACQENLRVLHQGLVGYSDRHGGNFPQVGIDDRHETAGSFVQALAEAGEFPRGFAVACPAAAGGPVALNDPRAVRYAYSLGYRGPNDALRGLRRADDEPTDTDLMPISADYPTATVAPATGGPVSPHPRGQNVLFVGGNVRFATVSTVGLNGDDIYRNRHGNVAAGVDRTDAVLGRAGDRP